MLVGNSVTIVSSGGTTVVTHSNSCNTVLLYI